MRAFTAKSSARNRTMADRIDAMERELDDLHDQLADAEDEAERSRIREDIRWLKRELRAAYDDERGCDCGRW